MSQLDQTADVRRPDDVPDRDVAVGAVEAKSPVIEPAVSAATALVVTAVVIWSYAPELRSLWEAWGRDPNYSHGYLVPIVSLAAFWLRGSEPRSQSTRPWVWAWFLLALVLGSRNYYYERGNLWAETVTLLPALACLALARGGWGLFRRSWPSIAFLLFMIPLPAKINNLLAEPLQKLATDASVWVLRTTGLWVISEGNVIFVNDKPLEVAEACNGLSMMMSLSATVAAMIVLVPMSVWMRVVLALSALPVALISNILRIAATAWCYQKFGGDVGARYAHDAAGWLMMPLALVLVGLETALLSWLVVEEETTEAPTMILGQPLPSRRGFGATGGTTD